LIHSWFGIRERSSAFCWALFPRYLTALAEASFGLPRTNDTLLGTFYLDYKDLSNNQKSLGPYPIHADSNVVSNDVTANQLIEDRRVREAEGFLVLARGLIDIANKTAKIAQLEGELYQYRNPSPQREDVVQQMLVELRQNLTIVAFLKDYLTNISAGFGGDKYKKEFEILTNYTNTFTNVITNYENPEKE
jgi:hypothetical protein